MSGRAGRDGKEATIHLLYTKADVEPNRRLLAPTAPSREELVTLYRVLRECCKVNGSADAFVVSVEELVGLCHRQGACGALDEQGVSNGLAVFEELGLLRRDEDFSPPRITLARGKRVELSASSRYLEGREELALFERFRKWALDAAANELHEQMTGPLVPSENGCVDAHE
jgi:single-stranded-DNA-specific exonuclease